MTKDAAAGLNKLEDNEAARKAFKQDEWNTFRVECRGDSIKTWINGVPAADLKDDMTPEGLIALASARCRRRNRTARSSLAQHPDPGPREVEGRIRHLLHQFQRAPQARVGRRRETRCPRLKYCWPSSRSKSEIGEAQPRMIGRVEAGECRGRNEHRHQVAAHALFQR